MSKAAAWHSGALVRGCRRLLSQITGSTVVHLTVVLHQHGHVLWWELGTSNTCTIAVVTVVPCTVVTHVWELLAWVSLVVVLGTKVSLGSLQWLLVWEEWVVHLVLLLSLVVVWATTYTGPRTAVHLRKRVVQIWLLRIEQELIELHLLA